MAIRIHIIIFLLISFLTSCRRGYTLEGGKVYYEYWNEGNGQGKRLIESADAQTFQELEFNCDCDFDFGKDKSHLYIDGELIGSIDPQTFKFIGNYIFRDKDSAYFFGFYTSLSDCVIKGVDPNKIELINYPWAKAGNILIYGRDTIYLEDINEFVPIDRDWGKTKKQVVNKNNILFGADAEKFEVISSFEGKDKKYNYEFGFIKSNEFTYVNFKSFNFNDTIICSYGALEFVDIYDKLDTFTDDLNQRIEIVEKLKSYGYSVKNIRQSSSGESKIINVNLRNSICNCYVEKFFKFDYSLISDTSKVFKITERMHCIER